MLCEHNNLPISNFATFEIKMSAPDGKREREKIFVLKEQNRAK